MKPFMLSLAVALVASQAIAADQPKPPANPGFDKLKSLVGEWKGNMKDEGEVRTTYRLVAADSAIEETLSHGNMVTMYHPDGNSQMLTHYCAAHNQPRLRAANFTAGDNVRKFLFVDASNMSDLNAMHMHNLTFTFHDADHFTQEWTMYQGGKETEKVAMNFTRAK